NPTGVAGASGDLRTGTGRLQTPDPQPQAEPGADGSGFRADRPGCFRCGTAYVSILPSLPPRAYSCAANTSQYASTANAEHIRVLCRNPPYPPFRKGGYMCVD